MELLSYVQQINKLENATEITITADSVSYQITRETAPVFTMGSSQGPDFHSVGRKNCVVDLITKDQNIAHLKEGQSLIICSPDGQVTIHLYCPYVMRKEVRLNNDDEMVYSLSLISADLKVEYLD
jgi:hypothetical protein